MDAQWLDAYWRNLVSYSASTSQEQMGKSFKSDPKIKKGDSETQRLTCFSL